MLNAEFGDGIINHHTYALLGDGCLMEGIGHEVISLAGHRGWASSPSSTIRIA